MATSPKKTATKTGTQAVDPFGPDTPCTDTSALLARAYIMRIDRDGTRLHIARLAGEITAIVTAGKITSAGFEAIADKAQQIDEATIDLVTFSDLAEKARGDFDRQVDLDRKVDTIVDPVRAKVLAKRAKAKAGVR